MRPTTALTLVIAPNLEMRFQNRNEDSQSLLVIEFFSDPLLINCATIDLPEFIKPPPPQSCGSIGGTGFEFKSIPMRIGLNLLNSISYGQ